MEILPNYDLYLNYLEITKPFWKFFAKDFEKYFISVYVDETNAACLSGWQNFHQNSMAGTNNSLEGFNCIMKEVIIDHSVLNMTDYTNSLMNELKRNSIDTSTNFQFQIKITIPKNMIFLGKILAENFDDFFFKENDFIFYIKEKYAIASMINPKTGKIKEKVNQLFRDINCNKEYAKETFLSFYRKPDKKEVIEYCNAEIKEREHFLEIISIKKIEICQDENCQDEEEKSFRSKCSCPDFFSYHFCIHLCACFWKIGWLERISQFKIPKTRGRKPRIG